MDTIPKDPVHADVREDAVGARPMHTIVARGEDKQQLPVEALPTAGDDTIMSSVLVENQFEISLKDKYEIQEGRAAQSSITEAVHHAGAPHEGPHQPTGTIFGLVFNTLTNVMGSGVLSLPYATYNGSIVISIMLLLFAASLGAFSIFVIILGCDVTKRYSYTECVAFAMFPDKPLRNGPTKDDIDGGISLPDEGLARRRRRQVTLTVELIILLFGLGSLVTYSRIIADAIPPVLRNFGVEEGFWTHELLWLIMPAFILFGLSSVKNLNELRWSSVVGFVTIIYIVIFVFLRYFTDKYGEPILPQEGEPGYSEQDQELKKEVHVFKIAFSCISTLATYSASYAYHPNAPYYYKELKDRRPSTMMKGSMIAFPIITLSYGVTGLFGYLTFGALVASSKAQGNIVDNYSDDDAAMTIGRIGLFFHLLTVYPINAICCRRGVHRILCVLANHGPRNASEAHQPPPGDPSTTKRSSIIIEAFVLVVFSTYIAYIAPGLGIVLALLGTFFGNPIVYIFPGLIGSRIFHEDISVVAEHIKDPSRIKIYNTVSRVSIVIGFVFIGCGLLAIFS